MHFYPTNILVGKGASLYNRHMTKHSYAFFLLAVALLVFFVLFIIPLSSVHAEPQFVGDSGPSGIVPCGDDVNENGIIDPEEECGLCNLVELASESLKFAVYFTVFVATFLIVYAGFLYITAGGESGKISSATKIFGKVVGGLVIVLVAWLVVDTLLKTFFADSPLNKNFGPWNQIQCRDTFPFNADTGPATGSRVEVVAQGDTRTPQQKATEEKIVRDRLLVAGIPVNKGHCNVNERYQDHV